jgi:hypothetical protein
MYRSPNVGRVVNGEMEGENERLYQFDVIIPFFAKRNSRNSRKSRIRTRVISGWDSNHIPL